MQNLNNQIELISKIFAVATAATLFVSTGLTNIFFTITIVLYFLAGNWREKINFIFHNPIAVALLLFFSIFIVGLIYTTAPFSDAIHTLLKYRKLLFAVLLMPLFREEHWRRYATNAFLCSLTAVLILSYLKSWGVIHFDAKHGEIELFKDRIDFSLAMGFFAYLLLLRIFNCHCERSEAISVIHEDNQAKVSSKLNHYVWGYLILLLLVIYNLLFMATGRSGYVVFMALIALFCIQKMRLKGLLIAALSLFLLVGTALLFSNTFKERVNLAITEFKTYHAKSQTSVGLRMGFVKNSLQLIKAHPIIGTGTGSFTTEYNKLNLPRELQIRNPHNEYLHIGVQFGIIGVMLLLTLFGIQLWFSRYLPDPWQHIAQAVIVAVMVGSCANSWLLDMTAGHFYAYFIALTFASLRKSSS